MQPEVDKRGIEAGICRQIDQVGNIKSQRHVVVVRMPGGNGRSWSLEVPDPLDQKNNVILLHDSGGKGRKLTVAALDEIIPVLQNRGYKFVRVSDLLGAGKHAEMFPPVAHSQLRFVGLDRIMFEGGFITGSLLG